MGQGIWLISGWISFRGLPASGGAEGYPGFLLCHANSGLRGTALNSSGYQHHLATASMVQRVLSYISMKINGIMIAIILLGVIPGIVRAEDGENKFGNWIGATSALRFSDKWSLFLQGELRTWEMASNLNELLSLKLGGGER